MEIPAWLMWVGGIVISISSAFGGAKLVEMRQARRYARLDRQQDITDANEGKRIDADQKALEIIVKRLEAVETDLRQLNEAHNSLMVKNAELQKDAHHAEKEMEKQAIEIKDLRTRNHDLRGELQQRDAKLAKLEARIVQLEAMLSQYQKGANG